MKLTTKQGNTPKNQEVVSGVIRTIYGVSYRGTAFISYDTMIVLKAMSGEIILDERYWDYSATTGYYRNQFLGEGIAETRKNIKSGLYKLANLN